MPRSSRTDVGHFWDLVVMESGTELMSASWMEQTAEVMMLNFAESGHPVFRATSAFKKEENLKSKECVMKSIHFKGSEETVEFIFRTVISVNQLSIYGAFADLCKELDPDSRNHTGIPSEILHAIAISQSSTSLAQEDLLQNYKRKFAELLDDQKLSKLCYDAGF